MGASKLAYPAHCSWCNDTGARMDSFDPSDITSVLAFPYNLELVWCHHPVVLLTVPTERYTLPPPHLPSQSQVESQMSRFTSCPQLVCSCTDIFSVLYSVYPYIIQRPPSRAGEQPAKMLTPTSSPSGEQACAYCREQGLYRMPLHGNGCIARAVLHGIIPSGGGIMPCKPIFTSRD